MIANKKIVVVMPAYNAESTIEKTYREIPTDIVDEVILVDDASKDNTIAAAKRLGIQHIIIHDKNKGYGGNQKTCYEKALSLGADIIIMLHPDYQYTPKLIPSMVYIIAQGIYPVVLGSRMLGKGALRGGMPFYKYVFNRCLTVLQNALIGQNLSEYHTGYRAFSREVLEAIPYDRCSNNFLFDNQILSQIIYAGYQIGEISCPTRYDEEASSINFTNSVVYGLGVIKTSFGHFFHKLGLYQSRLYDSRS